MHRHLLVDYVRMRMQHHSNDFRQKIREFGASEIPGRLEGGGGGCACAVGWIWQ